VDTKKAKLKKEIAYLREIIKKQNKMLQSYSDEEEAKFIESIGGWNSYQSNHYPRGIQ
jgi:GH18 family chitinase